MTFYDDLRKFGQRTCLIDEHAGEFSYEQIDQLCVSLQDALPNTKQLVLVSCQNCYEAVVGYIAVLRAGHVALMLNASTPEALYDDFLDRYQPNYIWRLNQGDIDESIFSLGQYSLFAHLSDVTHDLNPQLSQLLSTSGSTGSPKLVRLSLDNIVANATSIAEYLELDDRERPITTLPMAYSYGLSVINSHLCAGATILLTESTFMTKNFWTFLKENQASSMAGVPYSYEMLKRLRFARMDLPSLRTMTQAGGKLSPDLAEEFVEITAQKNIRFFIMYGQTEATARISYIPPEQVKDKFTAIGVAIPKGELAILDDQGRKTKASEIEGELVYSGPSVMLGYAENLADLAKGDELHGELKTGDLARLDDEGIAYITGRLKRIIKMYGNRLNLDDIDRYLKSQGWDGICGGEDDHLKVALLPGSDTSEVKKKLVAMFKFDHRAVTVFEVDEIPRTESGKIRYAELFES